MRFVARAVSAAWREGPAERVYWVLAACIVTFGVAARTWGVLVRPFTFWLDECFWATFMMEAPLRDLLIRPPGFMAVEKVVAAVFGPKEMALRFLPWLAGVSTTVMSPLLARRLLTGTAARLLLVAAVTLCSEAINYSKEFKAYAVGLFLHCLILLLVLRYGETKRERDLHVALVVTVVAVLFAQDVVFAYPSTFLALFIPMAMQRRRRELVATIIAGAAALSLVAAQYIFIWSKLEKGESDYWGDKYGVFYMGATSGRSHLSWYLEKLGDIVSAPGVGRLKWHSASVAPGTLEKLVTADREAWFVLALLGLACLAWRRRLLSGFLLVAPLLTLSALNTIRLWPFGFFRTNLFVLAYVCPIAAMALDWPFLSRARRAEGEPEVASWLTRIARGSAQALALAVPLVLSVGPLVLFEDAWLHQPHGPTRTLQIPRIVERLVELQGRVPPAKPELLILDPLHCDHWGYYTRHNAARLTTPVSELARRFTTVCTFDDREADAALRKVSAPEDRVWILTAPRDSHRLTRFLATIRRDFQTVRRSTVEASLTMQLRKRH